MSAKVEITEIQTATIEGGDQVGKADTVSSLAREFQCEDFPVRQIAFPQYATPIGTTIRNFLTGGISGLDSIEGTRRELEIRMMMYALDRLQTLESILKISKNPWLRATRLKNEEFLWMLDRSSFSNAVTIAYGLANLEYSYAEDDIDYLVNLALNSEKYFIEKLNLNNCVLELVGANDSQPGGWKSTRGGGEDQYETVEVQERVGLIYSKFAEIVGDGWGKIVTKNEEGDWIDREKRNANIRKFIDRRINMANIPRLRTVPSIIGVMDIARDVYGIDVWNIKRESVQYWIARDQNDKKGIYKHGGDIAHYIAENCQNIRIEDFGVKNAMYNILEKYPECLTLLDQSYGQEFVKKFRKAIYE